MFNKKTPNGTETGNQNDTDEPAGTSRTTGPGPASPPPLKPFAKPAGSDNVATPLRSSFHPDVPSRSAEIPGLPSRRGSERGREVDAAKTLMVGAAIHLKGGEISNCERLVVEGTVEDSTLTDSKRVEILPSGTFKGKASVEEAVISGHFDGDLVASARLTVRETGRISGSVRYGSIVIEPGGEIRGEMQTLGPSSSQGDDPNDNKSNESAS